MPFVTLTFSCLFVVDFWKSFGRAEVQQFVCTALFATQSWCTKFWWPFFKFFSECNCSAMFPLSCVIISEVVFLAKASLIRFRYPPNVSKFLLFASRLRYDPEALWHTSYQLMEESNVHIDVIRHFLVVLVSLLFAL